MFTEAVYFVRSLFGSRWDHVNLTELHTMRNHCLVLDGTMFTEAVYCTLFDNCLIHDETMLTEAVVNARSFFGSCWDHVYRSCIHCAIKHQVSGTS
jgi:hypothetical protein